MPDSSDNKYIHAGSRKEVKRLELQAKIFDKIIGRELEILGLKPGMKVLDVGCGTGAVTRMIAARLFPSEIHGIDIDSLFISKAKTIAVNEGIENIRFTPEELIKIIFWDIDEMRFNNISPDFSYTYLFLYVNL